MDGAYVGRVHPDSPAARAGLQPGDVIVELGQKPVRNAADLASLSRLLCAGEQSVIYIRHGRVVQGSLRL
jgi:S1-C subfamily serine protease